MGDFAAAAAAAAADTNLGCTFCCDCVWSEEEMAEKSAVAVAGSGRLYAPCASIILDGVDTI